MTELEPLSAQDLDAESATALPTKEVMSLLDLNANIDLALDLAAPVDLAAAANLNIAAPLEAAASANILSVGSHATALTDQGVLIDQTNAGHAVAHAPQTSVIDHSHDPVPVADPAHAAPVVDPAHPAPVVDPAHPGLAVPGDGSNGNLLDVNVNVHADVNGAAPIAGAVAANGNVAAPIDASVAANIGSIDSHATAVAQQTAIIHQNLDGATAAATAAQDSSINQ